jgi:O-antigen/teichoic acid export membrane protein
MQFPRYLIQSLPLFLTRGGIVALSFFGTLAVAAFLAPAEFGRFVFLWALTQSFGAVASLGGHTYLLREASARQGDPSRGVRPHEALLIGLIFPTALLMGLGLGAWSIGEFIARWLGTRALTPIEISVVVAAAWVLILLGHLATPFRIRERLTLSMLLRDAGPHLLLILGLGFALAADRPDSIGVLIGLAAVGGVSIIFLAGSIFLSKRELTPLWRETGGKRGPGLRSFWGNTVLGTATAQIDILLGALFLGSVELGQYQILKRLANLSGLPQIVANWTVVVGLGRAFAEKDLIQVQALCRKGAIIAFVPGLILLAMIAATLPIFFWFYEIPNVPSTWYVFSLLGAASLSNLACGVNFAAAAQCHLEAYALIARLSGVVAAIIIILVFGTSLTVQGLAFATLLSLATANMILSIALRHRLSIDTSVLSLWHRRYRGA